VVYEKYIEKNGKLYGPYTYHSKRVNGKVVSEYHGPKKNIFSMNFFWLFIGIFLLIILISSFVFFNTKISGQVSLNLNSNNEFGQPLNGILSFSLVEGELIPSTSKVIFNINGDLKEYNLSELIDNEIIEGNFYVKDKSLSGIGLGYGVEGTKKIYPEVDFMLDIFIDSKIKEQTNSESSSSKKEEIEIPTETPTETPSTELETSSTEIPTETPTETPSTELETPTETTTETPSNEPETSSTEIPTETPTETPSNEIETSSTETPSTELETPTETSSSSSESSSTSSSESSSSSSSESSSSESSSESATSSITGAIIKGFLSGTFNFFRTMTGQATLKLDKEISGTVSFGEAFNYELSEGETAEIKSGSVSINGESLEDSIINLAIINNKIVVTTDYFIEEKGFGEEYLGNTENNFLINLSKLNLEGNENITISFVYDDSELVSISTNEEIEEIVEILNESELQENITEIFNESIIKNGLTEDEKEILVSKYGNVSVDITKAEKIKDRVEVTFELEAYFVEHSYSSKLSEAELAEWIENDKIKFLKDIIVELSKEDSVSEELEGIVGNYPI